MNGNVILAFHARKDIQVLVLASKPASPFSTFFLLHPAHFLQAHSANTTLIWCRFEVRTRQFVRVVKETDSKSVGLCPRKFESCSCRFFAPLFFSFRFILLFHFITLYHITFHFITFLFSFHYSLSHPISNKHPVKELLLLILHVLLAHHHRLLDLHSLASRLDHLDLLYDRRALLLQHAQRLAITPHSLDHLGQQHRRGNTARRFHREDEVVPNHFQLH